MDGRSCCSASRRCGPTSLFASTAKGYGAQSERKAQCYRFVGDSSAENVAAHAYQEDCSQISAEARAKLRRSYSKAHILSWGKRTSGETQARRLGRSSP